MGREIKFRAWDGEEMLDGCMMDEMMCNQDLEIDLNVGQFSIRSPYRPGKFTLLQYTGLKDKNGKEIYEGDIVEERWNNPLAGGENVDRYRIETAETSLIKMIHSSGEQRWDRHLWMRHRYVEVIGNIFENPELIKGER